MDSRLLQAAQSGSVDCLRQLLNENPLILHSVAAFSTENPLHIASIAGHVEFVKEIVRLKPDFANQVNQDGFSPMHMAAANGYVEIVRELMNIERELCRLKGRDGMIPFHFAASNGRVEVIEMMLSCCPDCIQDVNIRRETALHIGVKNYQIEAVKILADRIAETTNADMLLNMRDVQGNTVLHLAAWKKQQEVCKTIKN